MLDSLAKMHYQGQVQMMHCQLEKLAKASNNQAWWLEFQAMSDIHASKSATSFGARLKELRRAKGYSQTELGHLVDLHYTHIGRYERGIAQPTGESLRRLADTLSVSTDYLLEGSTQDAAKADFEDRELLKMFKEVEQLPEDEKSFIKRVLDALLMKRKFQQLVIGHRDGI
jgi:transcriptional regulator with XRE-family HTH domain